MRIVEIEIRRQLDLPESIDEFGRFVFEVEEMNSTVTGVNKKLEPVFDKFDRLAGLEFHVLGQL